MHTTISLDQTTTSDSPDVTRRLVLAAGAAGALAATGCVATTDAPPQACAIPMLIDTVVTPPRTQAMIVLLNGGASAQAHTAMANSKPESDPAKAFDTLKKPDWDLPEMRRLIEAENKPFTVKPKNGAIQAALTEAERKARDSIAGERTGR